MQQHVAVDRLERPVRRREVVLRVRQHGTQVQHPEVRLPLEMVDELQPGRLLRSLKSGLATPHEGTTIFGRFYELED